MCIRRMPSGKVGFGELLLDFLEFRRRVETVHKGGQARVNQCVRVKQPFRVQEARSQSKISRGAYPNFEAINEAQIVTKQTKRNRRMAKILKSPHRAQNSPIEVELSMQSEFWNEKKRVSLKLSAVQMNRAT